MKIKETIKELMLKPAEQLDKMLAETRDLARALKFKASQNQLKTVRELRQAKQLIARIQTVLKAKKTTK